MGKKHSVNDVIQEEDQEQEALVDPVANFNSEQFRQAEEHTKRTYSKQSST